MYELFGIAALFTATIFILGLLIRRLLRTLAATQKTNWGKSWMNYLDALNYLFCKHYHRFQDTQIDLPKQGPAIVVSNHLSGLDPMLLVAATHRPLRYLIAREYYEKIFGLRWMLRAMGCIPVDRYGHPENALRAALSALKAGEVIVVFPHGTFSLPGETRKIKRGSLWLAQKSNCQIYPVFISGIAGVGQIVGGVLKRSHAKLVSYPPLDGCEAHDVEHLQKLLEGQVPPSDRKNTTDSAL